MILQTARATVSMPSFHFNLTGRNFGGEAGVVFLGGGGESPPQ